MARARTVAEPGILSVLWEWSASRRRPGVWHADALRGRRHLVATVRRESERQWTWRVCDDAGLSFDGVERTRVDAKDACNHALRGWG